MGPTVVAGDSVVENGATSEANMCLLAVLGWFLTPHFSVHREEEGVVHVGGWDMMDTVIFSLKLEMFTALCIGT